MIKILPILLISVFTIITGQPAKSTITITIENIKEPKGTVAIAGYNTSLGFLDEGKEIVSDVKNIMGNSVTFTIELPKEGEYAFAVYQDKNQDEIFNKNFIGIPKEPYGFSRIKGMVFSKPKFKKCKIDTKFKKSINIKLLNQ